MYYSVCFMLVLIFAVNGFNLPTAKLIQPTQILLATLKPGCSYHGKTYTSGQSFQPTPCEHCHCSSNGQVLCAIADCFYTPCVNPTHDPTKCCPVCPDGPNCYYGTKIIPAGQEYKPDNYTTCRCDQFPHFGFNRQAVCLKMPQSTKIYNIVN